MKQEARAEEPGATKAHPDVEPASKLLDRILAERRAKWEQGELAKMEAKGKAPKNDKWKAKYKEPVSPHVQAPDSLPEGWAWASLDQLGAAELNPITDGPFGSNLKTAHYTDEGPRVIRLQNIGNAEFLDEQAHISEEHYEKLRKHAVEGGDVIIAAMGRPAPRACLAPKTLGKAIVKADCIRFRAAREQADPTFFMYALNSHPTQQRTESVVHGVGRPRLNLGEIKGIGLPLPPISEQRVLSQEIERQLSVLNELETEVEAQMQRSEGLRQSILSGAFTGALATST